MNRQIVRKLVFVTLLVSVIKVSHTQQQINCLKTNPGVLDAYFNWYNKIIDPWAESPEEELQSMIKLFSIRFDKAFVWNGLHERQLLPLAMSVARLRAKSESTLQLFLKNRLPGGNSKNETFQQLKGMYNTIRKVHEIDNGTVGGLILDLGLKTYAMDLEVCEEVFGPLGGFLEFKLGMLVDKSQLYKSAVPSEFIKKLDFLVVTLHVKVSKTPELSADALISACDYLRSNARLKNITAEIFCRTGYPSKGTTANGVEGSLEGFRRFWCRVVERLTREKDHARIIMRSAFDESSTAIPVTGKNENIDEVFFGWWSRLSAVSSYASDFEEKLELLKNGPLAKVLDSCKCYSLDLTYIVGFLIILVGQFGLTVWVLVRSMQNRAGIKNPQVTTEDNATYGMSSSLNTEQTYEDLPGV